MLVLQLVGHLPRLKWAVSRGNIVLINKALRLDEFPRPPEAGATLRRSRAHDLNAGPNVPGRSRALSPRDVLRGNRKPHLGVLLAAACIDASPAGASATKPEYGSSQTR